MPNVEYRDGSDLLPELERIIEKHPGDLGNLSSHIFIVRRRVAEKPSDWVAKTAPIPGKIKDLLNAEYVMEIDQYNFTNLSLIGREAVLYEQLYACYMTENGSYKVRKPEVKTFLSVIDNYGGALPELVKILQIAKKKIEAGEELGVALDQEEEELEFDLGDLE